MSQLKFYKQEENIHLQHAPHQNYYPQLPRNTNNFSHSYDKVQQQTTNAHLEDSPCTSQALRMSSYQERQNNGIKDSIIATSKTQGDFSKNLDCVFIKISNYQYPIFLKSVESFEKSFKNAICRHSAGKMEILALKIVILQKYCGKNRKIKYHLEKALDQYCQIKYKKLQQVHILQS